MGSSVSITSARAAAMQEKYNEEVFFALMNKKRVNYEREAFQCFIDDSDAPLVSKERLLDVISSADCLLSDDWGFDSKNRKTHTRAKKIAKYLRSRGLHVHFDEGQMTRTNSLTQLQTKDRVRNLVEKSQCVIVLMTQQYVKKVCICIAITHKKRK
jgi:hypothetical protein